MSRIKQKIVPFTGCATALITPFTKDGVDEPAFERLIERQIAAGVAALVVLGTTGEPPTLSAREKAKLVRAAVKTAAGRVKIIAGVGGNDTANSVESCRIMRDEGADGLLAVTPYYNKTSPSGLIAHFTALADSADIPLIVYNVPGRTGLNLSADTMSVLADHPRVAALKEASSNIEQIIELFVRCHDRIAIYGGSDDQNFVYLALGGEGVISVLSNLAPKPVAQMIERFQKGDLSGARADAALLHPLAKALFCEVSPIPLKAALAHIGLCEETLRLPLVPIREDLREKLLSIVDAYPRPFA
ncbi:MAG: 4-hydroxy-tetrahydrodipicolinate synthase [Oscillospiraceae bacterium]|jgi:4-hydroxy-tetrahydrodipicolinate synthase|nr:4-hydroxy-tetrahydrodipicolinate synthase [Oscillospiraceae bacterium]